jgi:phosphate transport system substrate-binding protein
MYLRTILLTTALAFAGCSKTPSDTVRLNGAGATFPYPLYSKWMAEYHRLDPRVTINYQSIGSGGGIRQVSAGTVDFGASDTPMSVEDLARAGKPILHLPLTLGAVVLAYQLPGVSSGLRLSPEVLAAIFLGTITTWNDPALAALNPGLSLPPQRIMVVHRTDGSGTTAVFTEYLSRVSPPWKEKVGAGTSVRFPVGLGAKGNEGVAGLLKTAPGTLGYVELAYAVQGGLSQAVLRNRAGELVPASLENISAAAASAEAAIPPDLRVSITDAPGKPAYPIASFSFLLVPQTIPDPAKRAALVRFLRWAVRDGQKLAPALHYAPLPAAMVTRVEERLRLLSAEGPAGFER